MSNISIVNLSAYTSPKIQENKKQGYIEYGDDNNYFQFLIDRFLYSTTNGAIITGISNMIYGKGLDALDASRKPNEYAQMKTLFKPDMLRKVCLERKLMGMASMQIVKQKNKVVKVEHFPIHTLRAEKCNDKGEIEGYFYAPDWSKVKPSDVLKRIPAWGFGNGNEIEIMVIKPYLPIFHYYTPVDYNGALDYALLEEEISVYQINDVKNGFSGTKVINFNNGIPTEEMRDQIKADVKNKLTGSRGDKVIVAFNANAESKTTVEDIPLTDAPAHYEYLSNECFNKLIVGHRVTSPMLLGIRNGDGGLGNNADEIKTATLLFDNIVIKPYQYEIIEALNEILFYNEISLKLYFKTIQPLEFTELDNTQNADQVKEETGLSSHLDKIDIDAFGEEIDLNEWELVDSRIVDYDEEEELDKQLSKLNNPKKSILSKIYSFVSTGTARPNSSSKQDGELFKSRYRYTGKITEKSREFCKKMINSNKVYRKEDILNMENQAVNKGFGPKGADNYSIWLYKGGGACHHYWTRETYIKRADVNSPLAEKITPAQARKEGEILPVNDRIVYTAPIDMPNKGFLPK